MRLRLGGQLGVAGRTDLGLEPSRDGGAQRPGLIARAPRPSTTQRHAAVGIAGGRSIPALVQLSPGISAVIDSSRGRIRDRHEELDPDPGDSVTHLRAAGAQVTPTWVSRGA